MTGGADEPRVPAGHGDEGEGRAREPADGRSRSHRLATLLRPGARRGQVVVGVLCLLLGFAVAVQVQANRADTKFATAREHELVGILDDLTQRSGRLRADVRELERTKADLERDRRGGTALDEARKRQRTYALLAGTVPATGQGIELTIQDPSGRVGASILLDTLQELRDAGAEVMQVDQVRVIVDTYVLDVSGDGVTMDGQRLRPPYRFLVIGSPRTLATALRIPGGVVENLRNAGATSDIVQREKVRITEVRSPGSAVEPGDQPRGGSGSEPGAGPS